VIYSSGAVRIRTGSAAVKGVTGNEDFVTNAQAGYLWKLKGEASWYQIGAIINATNLTLTSRYANSTYQTLRSTTHVATMTTATKMYSGTLSYYPVIQENITLNASIEIFTDASGGGVLTGNASPAGSGTINYDTGAWSITLGTSLTATAEITASYYSGDTRTGLAYQIVTDYTPTNDIPEMSLNDINFPHIYTKAVRIIDSRLSYLASFAGVSASDVSNINASLSALFSAVNNLNASVNRREIVEHGTATAVYIATSNLDKIHRFSNTATCIITLPTVGSGQKGSWIAGRKKAAGIIDIKCQGDNTIDDDATHIYSSNASQTNALIRLSIETATNFEIEYMLGEWTTY